MIEKEDKLTIKWVVALLAIICCLLWGSAVPMIKTGYRLMSVDSTDYASQVLFAGCRFFLAGLLVILFACMKERRVILPDCKVMRYAPILCLAQTVAQYFFFYIGVANSSGVQSGILTGTGNFFAILMACFLFRSERISRRKLIGCLLGFAGVLVINLGGSQTFGGFHLMGEGFVMISQCSYALSTVLINRFSKKASPVILSGYQFMLGGLMLALIGGYMGGRLKNLSLLAGIVLLYLAFLSAVAYTLWSILLAHNIVSDVTIYGFINPICSVVLSALILGEVAQAFNIYSLVALALVCLGIYVVNARK